jgi:uncharacterized protein
VPVGELRRHTANRRPWRATVRLDGLRVAGTEIDADADIVLDLDLESVHNGVVAYGEIVSRWTAPCNRCLEPVGGEVEVKVREVFERSPTEGESYPLGTEEIDLEPMVRDALLLDLPLVAHCERPDDDPCVDLAVAVDAGQEAGGGARADPRWAALDSITFDD